MQSDFLKFEQFLGHTFQNKELLKQALTHPSYHHENGDHKCSDYQRLEFLGDSILGMLLAEMLCSRYSDWDEGALSQLRSRLAGQNILADRARSVSLGEYILLGRGEEQSSGCEKDSILSDVLEALIAAIYLDAGLDAARSLVVRLFDELAATPQTLTLGRDFKSELQEFLSSNGHCLPEYCLINESGPPHDRIFCFQVFVNGQFVSEGQGKSKKIAQQFAAAAALEKIKVLGDQEE